MKNTLAYTFKTLLHEETCLLWLWLGSVMALRVQPHLQAPRLPLAEQGGRGRSQRGSWRAFPAAGELGIQA